MAIREAYITPRSEVARERTTGVPDVGSLRGMVATILIVGLLTAPILLYVAAHARLTQSEYELTRLRRLETQEQERASRLRVDLAEATAAGLIQNRAEEMGLVAYDTDRIVRVTATVRPEPVPPAASSATGFWERAGTIVQDAKEWAGLEETDSDGE